MLDRFYQARPAQASEHALFASFFAELRIPDPLPEQERWSKLMLPTTFFLEQHGCPLGYAYYEVFGQDGYVRHVVTAAEARGRGVGRALMRELARRLVQAGCTHWQLNVRAENEPAIALYRACGMENDYGTSVLRFPWNALALLPGPQVKLQARACEVERDAVLEAHFSQPRGRLSTLRKRPEVLLYELVTSDGMPQGLACFDPTFPGCYPFLLNDPSYAQPLLAALSARRAPSQEWLQLVIEDNPTLAQLLLAKGCTLVFEILHFAGRLVTEEKQPSSPPQC